MKVRISYVLDLSDEQRKALVYWLHQRTSTSPLASREEIQRYAEQHGERTMMLRINNKIEMDRKAALPVVDRISRNPLLPRRR